MRSRLLGAAIAAAMAILPVVPPEHVHVIEEHGHHEVTVHRHAPLHAGERHGGATPLKFDHTDEPILTLALIYRAPAPVVIAAPPTTAFAWLAPRSASAAPAARANDAIEAAMGEMNAALKTLGKGVTAENAAASLETIARFQAAVLRAKVETPDSATAVEEKKRAEFVAGFRKQLTQALELSCQAEIALLDGKYKEAEGVFKNKLPAVKSAGHDKYKTDDK